jgi:dTDP-3-amino-3,4,6-trideoxy-alpha-D-glucopyranose N,N-dimethyltransferase
MAFDLSAGEVYDAVHTRRRDFPRNYEADAQHIRDILDGHGLPEPSLLDVACGTGLHLASLSRWYTVAGLDLAPAMVAAARQRVPQAQLVVGDIRCFQMGRRFGSVFSSYGSIAFAINLPDLRQAAATMVRHLLPGGVLLVEPWLPPRVLRDGNVRRDVVDEPDLQVIRTTTTVVEGPVSILRMQYQVVRPGEGNTTFEEVQVCGLFTDAQYRAAFTDAGLENVRHIPGITSLGFYIGTKPA